MPDQQAIEIKKGRDNVSIRVNLHAQIKKEKPGIYVSYCPALDLYSQGDSAKEARENIIEATQLFIESCFEDGTLYSVLSESGFYAADKKPSRKRRLKISDVFGGRSVKIPAEIPFFAAA